MQKLIRLPRLTTLAFALALAVPAGAQQPAPPASNVDFATGRVVGRVLDAQTGAGLSSVTIQVMGTSVGAISGLDGHFTIGNVPAGAATLRVSSIGYATKTITGVNVNGNGVVEQNIALETEAVAITGIEVTAAAERGSVNRALDQQRTATNIVSAITSEQITRSPDSDAAQAIQRVSGVTVQDGKFVVVRGLGERYTTTSLNGARIPSPEPERKLVPLDLFPSSLLETITTSKTFTPDQPGDFSGAQVDIKMREFPAQRARAFSTSFGWNGEATGRSIFAAPGVGGEWLGFAKGTRAVPANVAAAGRFNGDLSQADMNAFVNSFRNVWSAHSGTGRPTGTAAFSMGGNDPLFGRRIGYVLSGTYSNSQEIRSNEMRALAQGSTTGGTEEVDRYTGMTGRTGVLWGGVLNASTLLGTSSRIALSTTYNRSAENEARQEVGMSEQFGLPLEVTRLRYIERGVASAQLTGDHEFGGSQRVSWAVTGSQVTRAEPDRSEFVYATPSDPATGQPLPKEWFASAAEGAVRTFADLTEDAHEAKADYRFDLGSSRQSYLKFGALYRTTSRTAQNFAYSIIAPTLSVANRRLSPEQIFDGRFSQPDQSFFQVKPISQGGAYTADDRLLAGYGMIEFGLTSRIRATGGARVEQSEVDVLAEPTVGAAVRSTPSFTDVLPSLALNIALTDNQNLRLSASQTLARPEYRELAEVQYRDVIGAENMRGNPDLVRTLIKNFDVRWELYPASGEVLSVAVFGKLFDDPIERVYLGTSGTKIVTFLNAASATNYGIELEARKRLGFVAEALDNVTGFINGTLMSSEIEIGSAALGTSKVSDKRPMVGQSPYVVNAGLTYTTVSGATSVTALYNIFGERVVSAAVVPLPDVYEQARSQLDLSLRFPVVANFSAKLDVKNLLDAPYEVTQGTVLREYYRAGRVINAGFSVRL
jgi:TonB-dependent receptor